MLDELKSRFPHLEIDNCASGGRRLDYRMFRRAIPLFMTDYFCAGDHKNAAVQLQNFQLARWLRTLVCKDGGAGKAGRETSYEGSLSVDGGWNIRESVVCL